MEPEKSSERLPSAPGERPVEPGIAAAAPDGGASTRAAARTLVLTAVVGALAGIVSMAAIVGVRPVPRPEPDGRAAITASAPAPPVEAVSPPTWTGSRRTSWASDGSKSIFFELAATQHVPIWMATARPVLIVRCLSRATEVFVALGTSARFEEQADRRTVRIQWDDEPPSIQQWIVSETARELFAPDGVAAVRRMAMARRLRFGFSPFNAEPVEAEFAVQGFDQLAGLVAGTCSWRL